MRPQAKIAQMSPENPFFLDSKALFSKWLYNYFKLWLFFVQIG